jgi:hypothetical protein
VLQRWASWAADDGASKSALGRERRDEHPVHGKEQRREQGERGSDGGEARVALQRLIGPVRLSARTAEQREANVNRNTVIESADP